MFCLLKERKRRTSGDSGSDSGPTQNRKKARNNSSNAVSTDSDSVTANHTSPRKSGLVSRILDQPTTVQRPVKLMNINHILNCRFLKICLNYFEGYASVGC